MEEITHKILDSINKIERDDWDSIFGELAQGYEFYRACEESNLEGFSFYYILIYKGSMLALIAPLFIYDSCLDVASDGFIKKLILPIRKAYPRFLVLKTLFCGSPIRENGILGIEKSLKNSDELIYELLKIMGKLCGDNNISLIIFKDFLRQDCSLLEPLKTKGFFSVESFPSVIMDLRFSCLEEYFTTLSHNAKKDIRRKIKKAKSSNNIIVKESGNIEDIIEDVYPLYLNTYNAGSVKFEKLNKEFFINAGKMIPNSKFFLYYVEGKLAAFNLCLVDKGILIDEFIGFDYNIAYKYNLYFFTWCYNVEWCLKNSIKYYQVGQTDYYPKLRLGGRLIPLYALLRHNNPVLNYALRLLARVLVPAKSDRNIKDYKNQCTKTGSH